MAGFDFDDLSKEETTRIVAVEFIDRNDETFFVEEEIRFVDFDGRKTTRYKLTDGTEIEFKIHEEKINNTDRRLRP